MGLTCAALQEFLGQTCNCREEDFTQPPSPGTNTCSVCADIGELSSGFRSGGLVPFDALNLSCQDLLDLQDQAGSALDDFLVEQDMTCEELRARTAEPCGCATDCGPLCPNGGYPANPAAELGTAVGNYRCDQLTVLRIIDATFAVSCDRIQDFAMNECQCREGEVSTTTSPSTVVTITPSTSSTSGIPTPATTAPPTVHGVTKGKGKGKGVRRRKRHYGHGPKKGEMNIRNYIMPYATIKSRKHSMSSKDSTRGFSISSKNSRFHYRKRHHPRHRHPHHHRHHHN